MAIVIAASVLTNLNGPSDKLYDDTTWDDITPYTPPGYDSTKYNVILDQHSHTIHSDGDLTVRQNIQWHISMGYNTIVITDHNTLNHKNDIESLKAEYLAKGVIVILGMEWTTDRVHMNILGLSSWDLPIPSNPTDDQIKEAIVEAHNQGAVVTINHYPWSLNQAKMTNHPTRDQALEWGADFIEIVNDDSSVENVYDSESVSWMSQLSASDRAKIGMITGTDMHGPEVAGGGVRGWTLINAPSFTEETVMIELRNHRTEIIYSSSAYQDRGDYAENPAYIWVAPISNIGQIFVDMFNTYGLNPLVISIYVLYALIPYIGMEIYIAIKPRVLEKIGKARKNE